MLLAHFHVFCAVVIHSRLSLVGNNRRPYHFDLMFLPSRWPERVFKVCFQSMDISAQEGLI